MIFVVAIIAFVVGMIVEFVIDAEIRERLSTP